MSMRNVNLWMIVWALVAGGATARGEWGAPAAPKSTLGAALTPDGTTFQAWAPNARSMAVIGDFNDWKPRGMDEMTKDPATGIWSVSLKGARPGRAYKYLVNGNLARRDPRARSVTPDGVNSLIYDPAEFVWKGDKPVEIPPEDLVIYEVHVGTFYDPKPADGLPATFYDMIRKLDYLVELGVNCVELMPVHEFKGMHSWGYNPCDLFAVEQAYGGPAGLKTLVKACHERGIAVHLDVVHNHYGPENLEMLRFDGTGDADRGGIYFYSEPDRAMTPWGPRVRFDDPQVRQFVKDNAAMWLDEYHVDGFRWDSTVNIRAYQDGTYPLPAGQEMLDDINSYIRRSHPKAISIAEDSLDIGSFLGSWDYDFHHFVMPALEARDDAGRDILPVVAALGKATKMWRVVYVDNHDEAGKINGCNRIATDIDPANPAGERARKMTALGAVLTLTAPGIPLLFMGNEWLESGPFHDDRPLDWFKKEKMAPVVALHRDLVRLRRNLDGRGAALKGREIEIPLVEPDLKVLVYWRWRQEQPDDRMVVAINLSANPATLAVPFPAGGAWETVFNTEWAAYGGAVRATGPQVFQLPGEAPRAKTTLPPFSARLFARPRAAAAVAAAPVTAGGDTPVAAPTPTPGPARPPMSMYSAISLRGSFNDWSATAWPMRLVADYTWEYRAPLSGVRDAAFTINANGDTNIFWGADLERYVRPPYEGAVRRLGEPLVISAELSGDYLFRFNEDTKRFWLETAPPPTPTPVPAAAAPTAAAPAAPEFRTWSDLKGNRLRAKFVRAETDRVVLLTEAGRQLAVKTATLCSADQDYIRRAAAAPAPAP